MFDLKTIIGINKRAAIEERKRKRALDKQRKKEQQWLKENQK